MSSSPLLALTLSTVRPPAARLPAAAVAAATVVADVPSHPYTDRFSLYALFCVCCVPSCVSMCVNERAIWTLYWSNTSMVASQSPSASSAQWAADDKRDVSCCDDRKGYKYGSISARSSGLPLTMQ